MTKEEELIYNIQSYEIEAKTFEENKQASLINLSKAREKCWHPQQFIMATGSVERKYNYCKLCHKPFLKQKHE